MQMMHVLLPSFRGPEVEVVEEEDVWAAMRASRSLRRSSSSAEGASFVRSSSSTAWGWEGLVEEEGERRLRLCGRFACEADSPFAERLRLIGVLCVEAEGVCVGCAEGGGEPLVRSTIPRCDCSCRRDEDAMISAISSSSSSERISSISKPSKGSSGEGKYG